jgi:hypothetical protein
MDKYSIARDILAQDGDPINDDLMTLIAFCVGDPQMISYIRSHTFLCFSRTLTGKTFSPSMEVPPLWMSEIFFQLSKRISTSLFFGSEHSQYQDLVTNYGDAIEEVYAYKLSRFGERVPTEHLTRVQSLHLSFLNRNEIQALQEFVSDLPSPILKLKFSHNSKLELSSVDQQLLLEIFPDLEVVKCRRWQVESLKFFEKENPSLKWVTP